MAEKFFISSVPGKFFIVITSFFIIIFSVLLYISLKSHNDIYEDLTIGKAQYDLIEHKSRLPEGVLPGIMNTDGYINPADITIEELEDLAGLIECPGGQCAIDLNTGVKRCPLDSNGVAVYNPAFETCSERLFCTAPELPYAVKSSGETNLFGICDNNTECRCTNKKQCARYITSSLKMDKGDPFTTNRALLNYSFEEKTQPEYFPNGNPIKITDTDINYEFCQLNTVYTERLLNGCEFRNSINGVLGCEDSENYLKMNEDTLRKLRIELQPNLTDPRFVPETPALVESQQGITINYTDNLPGKVYLSYNKSIVSFNTSDQRTANTITNENTYVSDSLGSASQLGGNLGIGASWSGATGNFQNGPAPDIQPFMYQGCIDNYTGVNYKNMLLCIQDRKQPCEDGQMTYIVDDKDPLEFCTYSGLSVSDNYLSDPSYYTVGCMVGSGCGGIYDTNLCNGDNCEEAIKTHIDKFKNYDSSGMQNKWHISFSEASKGQITYDTPETETVTLENAGLLELENGDLWTTNQTPTVGKFLIKDYVGVINKTVTASFEQLPKPYGAAQTCIEIEGEIVCTLPSLTEPWVANGAGTSNYFYVDSIGNNEGGKIEKGFGVFTASSGSLTNAIVEEIGAAEKIDPTNPSWEGNTKYRITLENGFILGASINAEESMIFSSIADVDISLNNVDKVALNMGVTGNNVTIDRGIVKEIDEENNKITLGYTKLGNIPKDTVLTFTQSSATLYLNNVTGFDTTFTASIPGLGDIPINSIDYEEKSIEISYSDYTNLSLNKGIKITFYKTSPISNGVIGNSNNDNKTLNLYQPINEKDEDISSIKIATSFVIYKQFGFNGSSYNTNVNICKKDNYFYLSRIYSLSSIWAYWYAKYFYLAGNEIKYFPPDKIIFPPFTSDALVANYEYELKKDETPAPAAPDLTTISFNQPYADFKKNLSFYYPVWDYNRNTQRCVMCEPSLFTYFKINSDTSKPTPEGGVGSVVIQFSGKNFDQYMFYPKTWAYNQNYITGTGDIREALRFTERDFVFNFFSSISTSEKEISTTRKIYLNEVNPNIEVGDYVIDSENKLKTYFKAAHIKDSTTLNSYVNKPIKMLRQFDNIKNLDAVSLESDLEYYKFGERILEPENGIIKSSGGNEFTLLNTKNPRNFFSGKSYFSEDMTDAMFYMYPMVRVTAIDQNDKRIIYLDSSTITTFEEPENLLLQFIKPTETLNLEAVLPPGVVTDPSVTFQETTIKVNKITNGKISDLSIESTGAGYIVNRPPELKITKYRFLK